LNHPITAIKYGTVLLPMFGFDGLPSIFLSLDWKPLALAGSLRLN